MRRIFFIMSGLLAALCLAGSAAAADPPAEHVPGSVLVKFSPGVAAADKAALVPGRRLRTFTASGVEHWGLEPGLDVLRAAAALAADPRVAYAEPDYLLRVATMPDDPFLPQLWGLHNTGQVVGSVAGTPDADIDAPEAWDVHTDARSVIVAVLDTGLDLTHPDLTGNLWTNPGEIAANGLDDDGNGYVDDVHGWDFRNGDADPTDDNSHGTHCAGTIGAIADNGQGVAGVAWGARLLALKFQNAGGSGSTSDAIAAIEYAIAAGADVINASWGNRAFSQALLDALVAAYAADLFFVSAAGNEGTDNDARPFYPACYEVPNVIAVMATDSRDHRADEYAWSSNYGATTVDLAAPGVRIWSTIRNGGYMYLSGTSMATPHVAGALALLRGRFPEITVDEGRFRLLGAGNDEVPSLAGLCATGGRLNLRKLIADPDSVPPPAITDLAVAGIASNWVTLAWTSPGDDRLLDGYEVRLASQAIDDEAAWNAATPAPGTPPPAAAGTACSMRVQGLDASGTYWFAARARDEYGNTGPLSNSPAATMLPPPAIAVAPSVLTAALAPGEAATRTLTIANPGPGVLDFTIPHDRTVVAKAGSGGPDSYGYHWIDSDTPGGPEFTWTDISATGTAVALLGDSNQGPFEIGFAFPYYGDLFTTFAISTHGCVSLSSGWTTGANIALPSPHASGNLLALLWDEMTTGVGACHYLDDGMRLIVQYTGVRSAGAGGPFTMQMRLYPTGVIEYAYLTLPAPSSASATIGLQDGDGSEGLTIAFNEAYAHDELEIRISPPPPWLDVAPASGSVPAGTAVDVQVVFDSAGLCGTRFDGNLHVLSNDPLQPHVMVPTGLDLASTPTLTVMPDSLAFGPVRLTESATLELIIANEGCAPLVISDLSVTGGVFACPVPLPLVVAIGTANAVPVTFTPQAPGSVAGTLTLSSNDPNAPAMAVVLSGSGQYIPDVVVDPGVLAETLPTGGTATGQLTITNRGIAPLTWSIPAVSYVRAAAAAEDAATAADGPTPEKGATTPDSTVISHLGAGGPDAYGYRWVDSDATGGPAYNWIEIQTSGTSVPMAGDDDLRGPYQIGFTFPFYGREYTTFRVSSNGWISFATTQVLPNVNRALPTNASGACIAPYWDDLTLYQNSGRVYYRYDGQRLIVEFKNVPRDVVGGLCSFQIHLYPSGRIEFHYQVIPETDDSATIGIQNHFGNVGLQAAFNSRYAHPYLAVRFEAWPQWLTASPTSGTLMADASTTVVLDFDASLLCGGTHEATLHVLSNDPDTPDFGVPVSLAVTSGPDARLSPSSLAFGTSYLGQGSTGSLVLANLGCTPLLVTGLAIDLPQFTTGTSPPFSVAAGASRTIDVAFQPSATGVVAGALTLTSDSAAFPTLTVPLAGTGQYAGSAEVLATNVNLIVQPEHERTATVRVQNTGAGDLIWNVAVASSDKSAPPATAAAATETAGDGRTPDAAPLGSGGPDAAGYRWLDSDAPGGPVFSWIEIAGTGTPALIAGTDVMTSLLPIGFPVRMYGHISNTFQVNSDGWICLVNSGYNTGANGAIPGSGLGACGIAAFWDDLDLSVAGSGDIWYDVVDGNLVVEWDRVMRRNTTTPVTFEIIVSPSGAITFQYLSVSGAATNSATVGIQNSLRTVGLQVVYNAPYLHDGLAIRLWQPRWAAVSPWSGVIPPGGSADLALTFDAAGVLPGLHHGELTFQSNDIARPVITVPLVMEVKDYVSGEELPRPTVVALAQNRPNPFNPRTSIGFALPEAGPVELRVYDLRGRHVRTLESGLLAAGFHERTWDGRTEAGMSAPSGVYFCRLRAGGVGLVRRMTMLR